MAKKNKMKPRELREAQKKARQLKAAEINNNAAPAIAAMPAAEVIAPAAEKKKSSVKAAGMKSILVSENKMYITSFGKGNSAVLEYEVDNNDYNQTQLSSKDNSNIQLGGVNEVNITFSSKHGFESGVEINTSNPTHRSGESSPVRGDMLGLKSELEKRFFGKTFDDNIHIQLIYNILDIEKILAVYVTNIVYALNNMLGVKGSESHDDFIGYLSTNNIYDVFIDPDNSSLSDDKKANVRKSLSKFNALLKTKRLGYFGLEEPKTKDNRVSQAYKKRVYHMLAIVGQIRQCVFHDKSGAKRFDLYSFINNIDPEYRDTLDYLVEERLKSINKDFIEDNKVNISLLIDMMKGYEADDIIRLYYDFIVLKSQKNLGFSIKKLREKMLDEYGFKRTAWVLANTLHELKWDGRFSYANKHWAEKIYIPTDLNHNSDFVVRSHPAVLDGFVSFYRKAVQALNLFGAEHCVGDRAEQDFTGKVLVLSPDTLKESCWSQENQLWYAHDGFGCSPHAIGRSVRCTCLGDGEMTRWNRDEFIGVLDEQFLPEWAQEKLAELTAPRQEETTTGEMKLE